MPSSTFQSRIKIRSGKNKFSTDISQKGAQKVYFGQRVGLFQGAINIDSSELGKYSIDMQQAIGKAMVKLAQESREMARKNAPKDTGALRAGIYITAGVSRAELESLSEGKKLNQSKMKGHSAGYFRAINSAAKKKGLEVPGTSDEGITSLLIDPRTQRTKGGNKNSGREAITLDDLTETLDPKKKQYIGIQEMLPFNPLGRLDMSSFYVGLGSAMFYSAWVEYGTSKMAARPFFTPAAYYMTSQAPIRMAAAIKGISSNVGSIKRR